jgi:hypothetical protein
MEGSGICMALVACPECGVGVSDQAPACPYCGYLIAAPPQIDPLQQLAMSQQLQYPTPTRRGTAHRPRVQVIEQTSKFWKAQMLLASLLAIAGIIAVGIGGQDVRPNHGIVAIGLLSVAAGLLWFIVAQIGAWWNHG